MTKVWITLWLAPIILVLDEGSCLKVNDVPNILYNAFRERDRCRKHLEPRVQIRVCAHTHTHAQTRIRNARIYLIHFARTRRHSGCALWFWGTRATGSDSHERS